MDKRTEVWEKMKTFCPAFTRAHDVFDDPLVVDSLLFGTFIDWKPFAGAWAMDVGANGGIWSAYCGVNGAEVVAYEPDPTTFELLSGMLGRTGLANVTPVNVAIWTHESDMLFKANWTAADGRNGALQMGQTPEEQSWPVHCISFAQAVGDREWDCVKFDIEGAEFPVILATPDEALRKIKYLQIEFHHNWVSGEGYRQVIDKLAGVFQAGVGPTKNHEKPDWEGRFHHAGFSRK